MSKVDHFEHPDVGHFEHPNVGRRGPIHTSAAQVGPSLDSGDSDA